MRGFLYTVIVMILTISFMYVLTIQNSIQEMPRQNYDALLLSNYYHIQASLSGTSNGDYERVVENYKIMRNKM